MLADRRFVFCSTLTIVLTYLLILAGGVVRSSGSGMGCPDWPKCFGRIIPPTDVSQLPADYQTRYVVAGKPIEPFNAFKTWTEYINRLLGVLTGGAIFLTLLASLVYLRSHKRIVWLSLAAFIGVGLEGYIGAKVVSSNLHPGTVTVHLLLALIVVGLLIFALTETLPTTQATRPENAEGLLLLTFFCLILSLAQIALGTTVRERVDTVALMMGAQSRGSWLQYAGGIFSLHRAMAGAVVLAELCLAWAIRRSYPADSMLRQSAVGLLYITGLTVAAGVALSLLGLPQALQPVHLLLAALLAGIHFFVLRRVILQNKASTPLAVAAPVA